MAAVMVTYTSHVSGGDWSLSDAGWRALEAAGWKVKWFATAKKSSQWPVQWPPELDAEGRWMGALAAEASKIFSSEEEGIAEWESLTGLDARTDAPDCPCCDAPHEFETEDLGPDGSVELHAHREASHQARIPRRLVDREGN